MSKPECQQKYDFEHLGEQRTRIGFMLMGARSISPAVTFEWCPTCGTWQELPYMGHFCKMLELQNPMRVKPWRRVA